MRYVPRTGWMGTGACRAVWLLAACVVNAACGLVAGNEWPQWRGPDRDGISKEQGLLQEWPAGGPKLLWQTEGFGKGMSSVAVSGGRIYTLGQIKGIFLEGLALSFSIG